MDMSQILKMGASAFINSNGSGSAGSNLDPSMLASALSGLSGGKGGVDIASIVGKMQSGGMGDLMQSWLANGENKEISSNQISQLLGSDKISEFASQLGISNDEALGGLQEAMPKMVDNASSGGSLLDSVGGAGGIMNMAKKFFG